MKFLLITLFLGLQSLPLFGQVTLEYDLEKGEVFRIRQEAVQHIVQELDGSVHEIISKIGGIIEFKVIGLSPAGFEIDVTFKDLNLHMNSNIEGEMLNVQAAEVAENDVQARIFNSLLNVPVRIVLSRSGDVLSVEGGDLLVARMTDAAGLEDSNSRNLMKKSLEREFGSDALSESYRQMTYIYPPRPVAVGDQWENQYGGKMAAHNHWTLQEVNSSTTRIKGLATVTMDLVDSMTVMKLKGQQQTTVLADRASGFIREMQVKAMAEGSSQLPQLGETEIPTTIESSVNYKLINH